jgi:DNA-directed RNA polymerase subunit alpha
MEPSVKLNIEMRIGKGRGYVPSEENKVDNAPLGTIAIDSIFTPIKNVKYSVEDWRVEQKTDYEKLNIEITTDGSIHPKEALKEAATILIQHFWLFSDEKITLETAVEQDSKQLDEESMRMRHILLTKLSDMELSVRALNCLKAANIETFADLVCHQRTDLMKFRNFGKKSLNEIDMLMDRLKLNFGMDITKYNIEIKAQENEAQ